MIRVIQLDDDVGRRCDECGLKWTEQTPAWYGEATPYFDVRGALGRCVVEAVVCRDCWDAAIDAGVEDTRLVVE